MPEVTVAKFFPGRPVFIAKDTLINGKPVFKGDKVTDMDEETFKTLIRCNKIDSQDPYKTVEPDKKPVAPKS